MKPNDQPIYVHRKSNHPPNILKNIPAAINKRLATISADEESFNISAPTYQQALKSSGYEYKLKFTTPNEVGKEKRKRSRQILWYNPPYSRNVATNIGKIFLSLLKTEFHKRHMLHKLFNNNNVKVSYSCMNNMQDAINKHNKSKITTNTDSSATDNCNCRVKDSCPLSNKCLTSGIVYQATVSTNNQAQQTYIGLTDNTFKTRYANHKSSFKHAGKRNATELSKYIWTLKDSNVPYNIKWTILKKASAYNISTGKCNLCTWEKYYIIFRPQLATLNKRNELISTCRHAYKYLLRNCS